MTRARLFWLLLALFVVTLVAIGVIDRGLYTEATPRGIVSFEFCHVDKDCAQALVLWGERGRALAMLSLGFDYLFLAVYASLLCVALLLVAPHAPGRLHAVTRVFAWLALVAGLADAAENFCLIRLVLGSQPDPWALLATAFATLKFACLGSAFLWLALVVALYVRRRPTGGNAAD